MMSLDEIFILFYSNLMVTCPIISRVDGAIRCSRLRWYEGNQAVAVAFLIGFRWDEPSDQ